MEVIPQRYRSPPPKPPRRRHSDRLSVSSSGTFLPSRKTYVDENLGIKDNKLETAFNKSGCESLPANWTTGFPNFEGDDDQSLYEISSKHTLIPIGNPPVGENTAFDRCSSILSESPENVNYKNFNSKYADDMKCLHHVLKMDDILSKYNAEHALKVLKRSNCGKNDLFFKKKSEILKSLQKDCHRRHHSDPVISCFDRSTARNISAKSLKSHSFMGYPSSRKLTKDCDSVPSCSACKEIHCLYEEIKILKEINNKLWMHLCSLQACIENMQLKSSKDANSLSVSDLFSSLYYAQKAKDNAMEERLKVVIEDRDSALMELEEMTEIFTKSFEDVDLPKGGEKTAKKNIQELLHEIEVTCNPSQLIKSQRLLLAELCNSWDTKQDHLLHEFKFIVTERDNLLEKVQKLEKELETAKLCCDMWQLDNKLWENNLLDILSHVIQQRDSYASKPVRSKSIDSSYYSRSSFPKISYSGDKHINSNCKTVWKFEDSKFSRKSSHLTHESKGICSQLVTPADETDVLKGEIVILNKALEAEVEKRETMEEKCLRLERLVNVLRKKVNGQNVGILV